MFFCNGCKTFEGRDEGAARKILLLYLMEKHIAEEDDEAGAVVIGKGVLSGVASSQPPASAPAPASPSPTTTTAHGGQGGARVSDGHPPSLAS